MEVMGQMWTDKEKAGGALLAACRVALGGEAMKAGRYRGFELSGSINGVGG